MRMPPPFQRDQIWPEKMKRNLVDSILRGFYIPALLVYPHFDPKQGQQYWIIDGQQRLQTIFEFMDDKFRTGHVSKADEPNYAPLEPHKFFSALAIEAQEQFRSYPLRFIILDDVADEMLAVMFRRLQYQMPLTTAEKLWSYMSEATRTAASLSSLPFFKDIYGGRVVRKEPFQGALYALMVEMAGGFVNVQQNQLRKFAAGLKDQDVSQRVADNVQARLQAAHHLFTGTRTRALLEVIVCYQAVMLLELLGYNLAESDSGALTEWMQKQQLEQSRQVQERGYMSLFYQIGDVNKQKHFWVNQLSPVAMLPGLVTKDKGHAMTQTQRVLSWIRQSGICMECSKSIKLFDIDRHVFRSDDRFNKQTCAHIRITEFIPNK